MLPKKKSRVRKSQKGGGRFDKLKELANVNVKELANVNVKELAANYKQKLKSNLLNRLNPTEEEEEEEKEENEELKKEELLEAISYNNQNLLKNAQAEYESQIENQKTDYGRPLNEILKNIQTDLGNDAYNHVVTTNNLSEFEPVESDDEQKERIRKYIGPACRDKANKKECIKEAISGFGYSKYNRRRPEMEYEFIYKKPEGGRKRKTKRSSKTKQRKTKRSSKTKRSKTRKNKYSI